MASPAAALLRAWSPPTPRRRPRLPTAPSIVPGLPLPAPAGRRGSRSAPPRPAPRGTGRWEHGRFDSPFGSRTFDLYIPSGLRSRGPVPLLVALHGCAQTARDFTAATRWDELADRRGFLLVLPEQTVTRNAQRCWRWFESDHQQRGQGEPAIIAGIVGQVAGRRSPVVDRSRIYAAGLSAGAAMSVTLGSQYPDVFAAVAAHSGPVPGSAHGARQALAGMQAMTPLPPPDPGSPRWAPLMVVQGSADRTVSPRNADRLAQQWLAHSDTATALRRRDVDKRVVGSGSARTPRPHHISRWYAGRQRMLEVWEIAGLGHAWSGGANGGSFSDPRGPRATTAMWDFLATHRLPG